MTTGFFFDPFFLRHFSAEQHPENPDRLKEIIKLVSSHKIYSKLYCPKFWPLTSEEQILKVHSKLVLEKLKSSKVKKLDPDTYINKDSYEACLRASGAVLEAVRLCKKKTIDNAFCAIRPPGHHAESTKSMGFCLINNVAVAASFAKELGYKKILIIDFDVHHGNGTQEIFYEDKNVFYLSSHQSSFYPGTGDFSEKGKGEGLGYTVNWPFPAGTKDEPLISCYQKNLPKIVSSFKPELVFLSAGYDLHVEDPLADFQISSDGIKKIIETCLKANKDIPIIAVLEGGYNTKILAECVLLTLESLLEKQRKKN